MRIDLHVTEATMRGVLLWLLGIPIPIIEGLELPLLDYGGILLKKGNS